jgi:hypothetical protein
MKKKEKTGPVQALLFEVKDTGKSTEAEKPGVFGQIDRVAGERDRLLSALERDFPRWKIVGSTPDGRYQVKRAGTGNVLTGRTFGEVLERVMGVEGSIQAGKDRGRSSVTYNLTAGLNAELEHAYWIKELLKDVANRNHVPLWPTLLIQEKASGSGATLEISIQSAPRASS